MFASMVAAARRVKPTQALFFVPFSAFFARIYSYMYYVQGITVDVNEITSESDVV